MPEFEFNIHRLKNPEGEPYERYVLFQVHPPPQDEEVTLHVVRSSLKELGKYCANLLKTEAASVNGIAVEPNGETPALYIAKLSETYDHEIELGVIHEEEMKDFYRGFYEFK